MHITGDSSDSLSYKGSTPTRPGLTPSTSNSSATPVSRKIVEKQEQESPFVLDYSCADNAEIKAAKKNEHLAYTIVWSPLLPITWLIPFIGHTGICDSSGIASDFRGPYFVGDDGRMAFGLPTRALKIDLAAAGITSERWDEAIQEANEVYRGRMHNICCDNCHSHVAFALNHMPVAAYGVKKWDMVKIAFLVFFRAEFLSWGSILKQFLPFGLIVALIIYLKS
jgi:transmembrane protein 222